ncbi:hypothetical protein [Streptococcus intermedius]|uniref:hypothetical protein n=1 Tax=Streptococcus intermedius TaxID=1338 RepID=UPI000E3E837D|nr:hypothetical protein [Streptococcus intermedius]
MAKQTDAADFMRMLEGVGEENSTNSPVKEEKVVFQDAWSIKKRYNFSFYPQTQEKLKILTQVTKSKSNSTYLETLINREYDRYFGQ